MTVEEQVAELTTAVKIIKRYGKYPVSVLEHKLERAIIELNAQRENDKWTDFSLEECPCFDTFLNWAEETLDEILRDETPHGENGGDIRGYFRWNCHEWLVTYAPDWNRHDKQYYFIDNCGGNKTTAEDITQK